MKGVHAILSVGFTIYVLPILLLQGLLARAFCHEIDHLDGILYIDKAIPETIKDIK